MVKKPGLRQILLAAALLVVLINCAVAYKMYQRAAQLPPTAAVTAAAADPAAKSAISRDLTVLLAPHKAAPAQYKIIENKNLFSPQRSAWQPPEPVVNKASAAPAATSTRRDVVLDGVFILGKRRGAMMHMLRFSKQLQPQRLYEGETASDTTRGKNISYTLLKVEKDHVRLKDQRGKVFTVDLHSNKKNKSAAGASSAARAKVIVNKTAAQQSSAAVVAGHGTLAQARERAVKRRLQQQRERKVKSGELVPVKTPFGVTYVKAKKNGK